MPPTARDVRLVVLRHGPAVDRDPARWPNDAQRPLTPDGAIATRRASKGLARYLGPVDRLATSAAARCRATAEILRAEVENPPALEEWPELGPGRLALPILTRVGRRARSGELVVLVGHDPALSELLGLALTGDGTPFVRLAKGGAARLDFPRGVRPGAGVLRWLATRKQLARAA
ncbi:phosphohistidine phosphatase, SixA [mine drainage metagenome]|uniref:Phosphohistidine phosphatase, SixA n=1 Tax=mine drainage metagenome TaxID=410659 RepID=T1DC45_9ZZZZ